MSYDKNCATCMWFKPDNAPEMSLGGIEVRHGRCHHGHAKDWVGVFRDDFCPSHTPAELAAKGTDAAPAERPLSDLIERESRVFQPHDTDANRDAYEAKLRDRIQTLIAVMAQAEKAMLRSEVGDEIVDRFKREIADALPDSYDPNANYITLDEYRDEREIARFVLHPRFQGLGELVIFKPSRWEATFKGGSSIGATKPEAARFANAAIAKLDAEGKEDADG